MANEDVIKEMPDYYAHKPVRAARLVDGTPPAEKGKPWTLTIQLPDGSERTLDVTSEWMQHYEPNDDGWIVIGADGQIAYSRGSDFEPTFTKDAVIVQKNGVDAFSREHLYERDAKGRLVPIEVNAVDTPIDAEPIGG